MCLLPDVKEKRNQIFNRNNPGTESSFDHDYFDTL